jgi:hypothetical protein
MYFCLDCGSLFEEPKRYMETHGLDVPPYEAWFGCPDCGGSCVKTEQCELCGNWITGEYIKLNNSSLICGDCYQLRDVEDMGC